MFYGIRIGSLGIPGYGGTSGPTLSLDLDSTAGGRGTSWTFTRGDSATQLATDNVAITDPAGLGLDNIKIVVSGVQDGANEVLALGADTFPLNANKSTTELVGGVTFAIGYVTATQTFTLTNNAGGKFSAAAAIAAIEAITQVFSGTPTYGVRTFSFTIEADSVVSAPAVATVSVVDQVPVIDAIADTTATVGVEKTVTPNNSGGPATLWEITSGTGGSINPSTGVFTYTPSAEGTTNWTIRASNSGGSDTEDFAITSSNLPALPTTGLVLHLDPASLSLSDGATVSSWTDSSGQGNDASATSGQEPAYRADPFDAGFPMVEFAEWTNDRLLVASDASLSLAEPTVFVVWKPNTQQWSGGSNAEWIINKAATNAGTWGIRAISADMSAACRLASAPSTSVAASHDFVSDDIRIYCLTQDGTTLQLFEDNVLTAEVATGGDLDTTAGVLAIGNHPTSDANAGGYFGDVLVYDSNLDESTRTAVYDYLKAKYALPATYQDVAFTGVGFTADVFTVSFVEDVDNEQTIAVLCYIGTDIRYATAPWSDPHNWTEQGVLLAAGHNVGSATMIRDGSTWRMYYDNRTTGVINMATGATLGTMAASGSNPVLSGQGSGNEQYLRHPAIYKDGSTYYLMYDGRHGAATSDEGALFVATSTDGVTWMGRMEVISPQGLGFEDLDCGKPNLIYENGVWYAAYAGYGSPGAEFPHDVGIASSRNFAEWTRLGRNPIISHRYGDPDFMCGGQPSWRLVGDDWFIYCATKNAAFDERTINYYQVEGIVDTFTPPDRPFVNLDAGSPGIDVAASYNANDTALAFAPNAVVAIASNPITQVTIVGADIGDGDSEVLTLGGTAFPLGTDKSATGTAGGTTIAVNYVTTTQTFTITNNAGGSIPAADVETLQQEQTYFNDADPVTTGARTFTFTATDGTTPSQTATATITVFASSTTTFDDTFTGTNGTALNAHTPDTDTVGSGWTLRDDTVEIQSNAATLRSGGSGNPLGVATFEGSSADGSLEMQWAGVSGGTATFGMVFRYNPGDGTFLFLQCRQDGRLQLQHWDGAAYNTLVANQSGTANAGTVKVVFTGTTIEIYDGGSLVTSTTSSINQTAVHHGLRMGSTAYSVSQLTFSE